MRQIITDWLEHAGFAVSQACDGLHGLAELRQRQFEVVVTDYQMPRLNGLALLRQCELSWPETAINIMSAALDVPGEIAAGRLAFTYIQKPFDADRLITLVCQAAHFSRSVAPPSSESGSNTGR